MPLDSVRLIKVAGGMSTSPASIDWHQACASANGDYIYADPNLLTLVDHAQSQECVQADLQMCYPPTRPSNVVTFGLPLPIGFITAEDLTQMPRIEAQFVVQAYDIVAKANVLTTLSMSVDVSPLGFTAMCETASASQNLADVVSGNIYVGTATNEYEWNTLMQKKENMDVPGEKPSNSLEFATTSVQGALLTFAALGSPAYFEDARYHGQSAHMRDIFTVHFLEPLSGKAGDPTPNFDAAKALFLAGDAFVTKTDASTHSTWLEPTPALLAICPLRPTIGKLACLTRIDSTFKDGHLTRAENTVAELRIDDSSSIVELQALMSQMLLQGGSNDFTNNLGSGFYAELSSKLSLNNRYRKAYVVNPVINWHTDAMLRGGGSSAHTVSSKIIGIGMITLESAAGTQLSRRLLSMGFSGSSDIPSTGTLLRGEWMDGYDKDPYGNEEEEVSKTTAPTTAQTTTATRSRRLLQDTISSAALTEPSMMQTSNSLVVSLNIPEKTAVTQLCPIIGASAENCRGLQYTTMVNGEKADQLCAAEAQGTLNAALDSGLRSSLMSDATFDSNISSVLLMDYSVSGCGSDTSSGAHRRALRQVSSSGRLVIVITNLLLTVNTGVSDMMSQRAKEYVDFFTNATIMQQLLGGSAVLVSVSESMPNMEALSSALSNNYNNSSSNPMAILNSMANYLMTQNLTKNLTIIWDNVTLNDKNSKWLVDGGNKNLTNYLNQIHPTVDGIQNNDMFIYDRLPAPENNGPAKKSSASRSAAAVAIINTLTLLMLSIIVMSSAS